MSFENLPYTNFHDLNLSWVLSELKNLKDEVKTAMESVEGIDEKFVAINAKIEVIESEVTKILKGEALPLYIDAMKEYFNENIEEYISNNVKYVMFGLDNDGHFVAMIPDSWDFITFDTIVIPNSPLYGRLVLSW